MVATRREEAPPLFNAETGLLDRNAYLPAIVRGWQAMRQAVHDDTGFVGYLQGAGSKPEDGGVITFNSVPDFVDFGIGCWLWGAAEVHALAVLLSDESSNISNIAANGDSHSAVYYNLSGQRVTNLVKGRLYIHKGVNRVIMGK